MFGGLKKQNKEEQPVFSHTILSAGTLVRADVYCEGVLIIEGVVEGNIVGNQVFVKPNGRVDGKISCRSLVIEKGGLLNGELIVRDAPALPAGDSQDERHRLAHQSPTP